LQKKKEKMEKGKRDQVIARLREKIAIAYYRDDEVMKIKFVTAMQKLMESFDCYKGMCYENFPPEYRTKLDNVAAVFEDYKAVRKYKPEKDEDGSKVTAIFQAKIRFAEFLHNFVPTRLKEYIRYAVYSTTDPSPQRELANRMLDKLDFIGRHYSLVYRQISHENLEKLLPKTADMRKLTWSYENMDVHRTSDERRRIADRVIGMRAPPTPKRAANKAAKAAKEANVEQAK
jgi:hypothetical protein